MSPRDEMMVVAKTSASSPPSGPSDRQEALAPAELAQLNNDKSAESSSASSLECSTPSWSSEILRRQRERRQQFRDKLLKRRPMLHPTAYREAELYDNATDEACDREHKTEDNMRISSFIAAVRIDDNDKQKEKINDYEENNQHGARSISEERRERLSSIQRRRSSFKSRVVMLQSRCSSLEYRVQNCNVMSRLSLSRQSFPSFENYDFDLVSSVPEGATVLLGHGYQTQYHAGRATSTLTFDSELSTVPR